MQTNNYFLAVGEAGLERMKTLNTLYNPSAEAFIEKCIDLEGKRVLDIGAGIGELSAWFATQTGGNGQVIGIDQSAEQVELANGLKDSALEHLSFIDASSNLHTETGQKFDLVHARWLLLHSLQPEQMIADMKSLLSDGGKLVLQDCVTSSAFCTPHSEAFEKFIDGWVKVSHNKKINHLVGDNLVALLTEQNMKVQHYEVFQPLLLSDAERALPRLSLKETQDVHIDSQVYQPEQINSLLNELKEIETGDYSIGFVRNVMVCATCAK